MAAQEPADGQLHYGQEAYQGASHWGSAASVACLAGTLLWPVWKAHTGLSTHCGFAGFTPSSKGKKPKKDKAELPPATADAFYAASPPPSEPGTPVSSTPLPCEASASCLLLKR